jgi:diguanylate cyclase (GGDEF)-like protein/putative nucleotidyltransferase with HDIG domain
MALGGPGIIVAAAESAQPVLVNDVSQEPRYVYHPALPDTKSELAVPLQLGQEVTGVLDVQSDRLNAFDKQDVATLEILSRQIAIALKNAHLYSEVSLAAATDPLTKLWNRRSLEDRLESELSRAVRFGLPVTLLLMDVDNFKLFNDTYGHPTGDAVLKMIANTLKSCSREMDVVGRYGGDEFAAILPETDVRGATNAVRRIRSVMRGQSFLTAGNVRVPLSLSIGVASFPVDASDMNELLFLADSALYEAKHAGGGTFCLASSIQDRGTTPEEATFDALRGLVISVDNKDSYTQKHSQDVARYAMLLARRMGSSDTLVRNLEIAGLLHDVGKIGIPDRILRKPGGLSQGEREVVQGHSSLGHMILKQLPHLTEVLKAVLHHHERYDGQGYPAGLKGEEIPYLARMLAVADAYSAMTSDRPYRLALTKEQAIAEIRANKGTQFDPEIAEAFIQHCLLGDGDGEGAS